MLIFFAYVIPSFKSFTLDGPNFFSVIYSARLAAIETLGQECKIQEKRVLARLILIKSAEAGKVSRLLV